MRARSELPGAILVPEVDRDAALAQREARSRPEATGCLSVAAAATVLVTCDHQATMQLGLDCGYAVA